MDPKILQWAETQSKLYQVLTNPIRVLILRALNCTEMSVSDISATVGSSMQNTSQHLRLMKDRGLLESRRDGQTIYYRIRDWALLNSLGINATDPNESTQI